MLSFSLAYVQVFYLKRRLYLEGFFFSLISKENAILFRQRVIVHFLMKHLVAINRKCPLIFQQILAISRARDVYNNGNQIRFRFLNLCLCFQQIHSPPPPSLHSASKCTLHLIFDYERANICIGISISSFQQSQIRIKIDCCL